MASRPGQAAWGSGCSGGVEDCALDDELFDELFIGAELNASLVAILLLFAGAELSAPLVATLLLEAQIPGFRGAAAYAAKYST